MTQTIPSPATTADQLTEQIIADMKLTTWAMKCAMSERLVRLGVSMAQFHILVTLQRSGVVPMSRLADQLGVSQSNASGLIDRLEERGFVVRTRVAEDRRIVLVTVTEAGARLIQENDALSDELLRDVLARLNRAELPAIARATAEVRAALEATTTLPARNLHESATQRERAR